MTILFLLIFILWGCGEDADTLAQSSNPPGGFVENQGTAARLKMTLSQIQAFVPATRASFTFPAPYNTRGYRITIPSDCPSSNDCVSYVGYSYWPRMNNHANDSFMYIVLNLSVLRSAAGMTLYRLDKNTFVVTKVGNLFPPGTPEQTFSGEHYYFSFNQPYRFYFNTDTRLRSFDIGTQQFAVHVNILNRNYVNSLGQQVSLGCTSSSCDRRLHQTHVNGNDTVFAGTLTNLAGSPLGCWVYRATVDQFRFYPSVGTFDECNLDRSGRYTISLENLGTPGDSLGNRIFDNTTGVEILRKTGPSGTLGHLDMGYEYALGADNNGPVPPNPNSTTKMFLASALTNQLIHFNTTWDIVTMNHPSHTNARPTTEIPIANQFFCGSNADSGSWANEIMCAKVDGSVTPLRQLVVAPVMTDVNASGGNWQQADQYDVQPKGHLDPTGRYFLWTTNMRSSRMDAFIAEVPSHLLTDQSAPLPPANLRVQ